jgi:hypothetical protein
MTLMVILRLLTGSTVLALVLALVVYELAVWFLPTTIEQAFLITADWPWPRLLAFWALVVCVPIGCALALVGRASPGPLRPAT